MKRLTNSRAPLWIVAIMAAFLVTTAGAYADSVILTTPAPVIVPADPVIVTPPTTIVEPQLEFVQPSSQIGIPTMNGMMYVPAGSGGSIPTSNGGFVRYWTNSDGTVYYQDYDSSGNRSRRHRL